MKLLVLKTYEVNRMNRKIKLDEVLEEVQTLREQNRKLILENEEYHEMLKSEMDKNQDLNNQLERQVRFKMGLKFSNRRLTQQRNELQEELDTIKSMSMFEFGNTYCSSESLEADGHLLARELLGVGQ
jgi:hypothetical protein